MAKIIKKIVDLFKGNEKEILINTLYYKLVDDKNRSITQDFKLLTKTDGSFFEINALLMTNNLFELNPETRIVFEGKRVNNENTIAKIKNKQYLERFFIRDLDGDELEGSALYDDEGSGFATGDGTERYIALGGTGKYKNATYIDIKFDNEGKVFGNGRKKTRQVEIYGTK